MRVLRLAWMLLAALLVTTVAGAAETPDWETLKAVYDYDASLPLAAEVVSVEETAMYSVEQIRFTGTHGERVPATLMRPNGVERPACVLFLHGLGGDRGQARIAAMLLIPQGVAVFGIDAALHGDRAQPGVSFVDLGPELAGIDGPLVKTVVDNRRAIDYIETRDDIDAERIILVGASMGGMLGSLVSAVDERVGAVLLLVAGGAWDAILQESEHPLAARLREAGMATGSALAHIEPVNFIGHVSPRPVMMINGTGDEIIPASSAQALYDAACEPKQIRWFEGGHVEVPPEEIFFLAAWVAEQARERGSGAAEEATEVAP